MRWRSLRSVSSGTTQATRGRRAPPPPDPRARLRSIAPLDIKLHVPPIRSGIVARSSLVDQARHGEPVVVISAPAGYGKTAMAQSVYPPESVGEGAWSRAAPMVAQSHERSILVVSESDAAELICALVIWALYSVPPIVSFKSRLVVLAISLFRFSESLDHDAIIIIHQ